MLDHNAFQLKIIQLSIPKRLAFKEVVDILVHFSIFPVYKKWSREMKLEGRQVIEKDQTIAFLVFCIQDYQKKKDKIFLLFSFFCCPGFGLLC